MGTCQLTVPLHTSNSSALGLWKMMAALTPTFDWRFLAHYPRQYVASKLSPGQPLKIDGLLNESAWAEVPWTSDIATGGWFVDITHHPRGSNLSNSVPHQLQARAKIRWDDDFLYIGAELREPFILANVTGHNGPEVPYHDNDFEVFIDVSGTTQYYKEFEMSARNATYDVLWGVPDGAGLSCAPSAGPGDIVPVCVNTSSPFYAGNWSMVNPRVAGLAGGGMTTATSYKTSEYATFVSPYAVWTAEIAFPLRSGTAGGGWHGGLLDATGEAAAYASYDPSDHEQVYWHFDISRAEHPRAYASEEATSYCPFDCGPELAAATPQLSAPSSDECAAVLKEWPTLLGVDPWNCYWEWVWSDVGSNNYMHRPLYWAVLQFASDASSSASAVCKLVEWPGRYLARQVYVAQQAYSKAHAAFASDIQALLPACVAPGCDPHALRHALSNASPFEIDIAVTANASVLSALCPTRPCYLASVRVAAPLPTGVYRYNTSINSNSRLVTSHSLPPGKRPCL